MIEDPDSPQEPSLEVLRTIGSGATARVELVRLLEPFAGLAAGSELALKTLDHGLAGDERARAAFRAEAEALALVRHPSLVRAYHHGGAGLGAGPGARGGLPHLLLQHVPGRSLREILDAEGALPEPRVREIGAELGGALAALHAAGLAHGDVKPENVRLDDEGRAVLLDLGFARRSREREPHSHAGSLAYLSPERARGEPASAAADVFALGVVLYELLTSLHPFGWASGTRRRTAVPGGAFGSTSGELLRRSIEVPGADQLLAAIDAARVPPPSHFDPKLSPFADRLLGEVLARASANRPAASEVEERLHQGEASEWWRRALDPTRDEGIVVPRSAHRTPLVGRERELAQLEALLAGVRAGERPGGRERRDAPPRAAVVWLAGPEGSGKWRLASEFAERARTSEDPPLYLYTRWSETVEARPAGALSMLVNRWLFLPPGTPPGERETRRLEELLPLRSARTLRLALDPRAPRALDRAVPTALAEWLQALGRERPVLLFLDDVHRAGPGTLGALSVLLDSLGEARVLLVIGLREDTQAAEPELLARLSSRLERSRADFVFQRIDLLPLDRAAVESLVQRVFHPAAPQQRLAEVLWQRSRGNPGFLTEILRDRVASGAIHAASDDDPRLVLAIEPEAIPKPRSLDRLIAERVRALEAGEKMWLERLAVVGGRLTSDFLVRAFPPTKRSEIDSVLSQLTRKGWLVPVADRYRFERPALREAVYRSIASGRRRRLHLAAARGLTNDLDREATVEEAFQRAFHLHAASEHAELLDTVMHLVRPMRRRASAQRLLTLARWGLEALEHMNEPGRERAQLELLELAADAADRLGKREDQRSLLDHMSDLSLDERPSESARLYLLHARYAAGTGQFGLARGWLKNAVQLATASGDRWLESQALRRFAHVQAQIGEFADARSLAERSLAAAAGENQQALAHLALAHVDVLEDRIEHALESVDHALSTLKRTREARAGVVAYAYLLRTRIWRSAGFPLRALASVERAIRLARRAGERRVEAEARARRGGLLLDIDRPARAEIELRDAQLLADEIEDRRGQVLSSLWLGLLHWEEDDPQAAESIRRSLTLAREIGFYRAEALGLALQARLQREKGQLELAEADSALALELLGRHGAELADRIAIAGTRVLVLRTLGRKQEAQRAANELRARMRKSWRRIQSEPLRAAQKEYARRMLEAVLSSEGPVFPRRKKEPESA